MDDIETLKVIKEKETSSEDEIKQLKADQERILAEVGKKNNEEIENKKRELEIDYEKYIESAVKAAEEKAQSIIDDAKNKAKLIDLNLDDAGIKKLVFETLEEYLGD